MSELHELPDGWEWKTLGEITELITKGTTPTTNGYKFQSIGINFLKIENIVKGEIDLSTIEMYISEEAHQSQKRSQLRENDVLFSIAGTIGDTAIVKKEHLPMNTNQAIALIRPKDSLNSFFLRYSLTSIISQNTKNKQRGGAIKNISLGDIKGLMYPLPPLPEQQRIVSKLDLLFEKIDKAIALHVKNMEEANVFMGSVLNDVFGELEEKYEKKQLSNLVSKLGDGLHGTPKYDEDGEYYFINGANVKDNKIVTNQNTKKVNKEEYQKYKKELNDRTVFVSINGTIGNIGLYNNEKCILGKSACYFNLLENINKIYITYALKNGNFQEYIEKNSTGATIKNVSLKTMRAYKITLPPLQIQQKVVIYLDEISQKTEKIKQLQKEKTASLKALKASILDRAFRGEL